MGSAFRGEQGRAVLTAVFNPQRPSTAREDGQDHQKEYILTTTCSRELARELRALVVRLEISELRAWQDRAPYQELTAQKSQERPTIILDRFMIEAHPSVDQFSVHGSLVEEIAAPPYALSEGGRRRYERYRCEHPCEAEARNANKKIGRGNSQGRRKPNAARLRDMRRSKYRYGGRKVLACRAH